MKSLTRLVLVSCAILFITSGAATAFANPFVINEVVNSPQQDWNDAAGTPFDGTPGGGTATDADEYIELLNVTAVPQSLEDYYLEMLDSTPEYDCFSFNAITPPMACTAAEFYVVYDSTGALVGSLPSDLQAVPAGGYVVIGNPNGGMITSITVTLVDDLGATIDTMAPVYASNFAANESASRFPDGVDTGDDAEDFAPKTGTPGSNNGALCTLAAGAVVVNEVVSDPEQDWEDDGGPLAFTGTAGVGAVGTGDEYVELKNTSGAGLDLTSCVLDMVDASREKFVFSVVDAAGSPYVRVFNADGTLAGGASMINSIPMGGYVLLGNPSGSLSNAIAVSVVSDAGANDTAMVNAAAGSLLDESASRFPDGGDTDIDADDFAPIAATPGASNGQLCSVATGAAVVNEVLTDPQQDFNHDDLVGTPFIGPGSSTTINADDEFVELKNTSGAAADLTGCVLVMNDGTDEKWVLQAINAPADPYVLVFDDLGAFVGNAEVLNAVPMGGYVLIGDPPGSLNNGITVALEHDQGTLDSVTVSANANGLLDETASRFPDGADTDVDVDDITALRATPGANNGQPCALGVGDAVINEVITDPQQDWDHDGASTAFDGTAMAGTSDSNDELVELKNTSGAEASFEGCTVVLADTSSSQLVLQALDAVADPWISVFDDTGARIGGATSLGVVPAGGYVLIGNPPGTLNNDVVVSLLGVVELDVVDFGGDAPGLNASDAEDESGSRVPDGADTDVGANDFQQQRATPGASNEIDECALAIDNCDALASCTDTAAGFDCMCPSGYLGTGQVCTDANECQAGSDDCDNNALCTNTEGSFTCACNDGFTGDGTSCTDVDECGNGAAQCDANAACVNTPGTFNCVCNEGFEGDGTMCTDTNECVTGAHDCGDNAFCTNTPSAFDCACDPGFEGDGKTCTAIDGAADPDDPLADDAGCSCTVGPREAPSSPLLWLLGLGAMWRWRRRREQPGNLRG